MTSNKLILIFLGFIFFAIVLLSSSRISAALRSRFGNFVPSLNPTSEGVTPTPTPSVKTTTPTPTPTIIYGRGVSKNGPTKNIPATGPEALAWLVTAGSFLTGFTLKKIGNSKKI